MNPDVCLHENVEKEVMMGIRTGDRICKDCGALFASLEELKEARNAARAAKKNQPPKEASFPD